MKFDKKVRREVREFLTQQLKEYEQSTPMSQEERQELRHWVASGHSPYENGDYVCGENGLPIDFISARRSLNDYIEWFNSLSEEEQQQERGHVELDYNTWTQDISLQAVQLPPLDPEDELPFQ
jgi:hypothetical protein